MSQQPLSVVFYGRSGSGKGTQADLLETYLGQVTGKETVRIETGQGIRLLREQQSHTGRVLKDLYDRGGLMPPFLPIWVWAGRLIEDTKPDNHIIFDGVCRRIEESPLLYSAMRFYGRSLHVCLIEVSPAEVTKRMKLRGRSDDGDSEIKNRLDWYEADVVPAIEYFKNKEDVQFHSINGEQTPDAVFEELKKALQV